MNPPVLAPSQPGMAPTGAADPLAQLRDIHLPAPVDWWPPAPGWWLLGLLLLALLGAISAWALRRRRRRRYRRVALREVDAAYARWQQHNDARTFLQELNRLLKQAALSAFPPARVAALNGAQWLEFLDSTLPRPQFDRASTRVLADIYRADPAPLQADELRSAARIWLRRHRC
jgi:hypothetical protein